jgi:CRISPR-associated endonuclease/helicase Cas3
MLRKASDTSKKLLANKLTDPIDQSVFHTYFSELYWKANSLDGKGIMDLLKPDGADCGIQFRTAADAFKLIDDRMQRTIVVPYGEGKELIGMLKGLGPERWLLRKLQRFAVNIYVNQFNELFNRGSIEEMSPGIFALKCEVEYDQRMGLLIDEIAKDPELFMS